ncbi:MAG: hypothetical protein ACR2HV_03480 [Acidimicrobiales bacterium]
MSSSTSIRYRCGACGNLTRFDVTTTRRTRAYHHYTLSGDLSVEDPEVLSEIVEEVSCRWCGSGRSVEPMTESLSAGDSVPAGEAVPAGEVGASPEQSGG